MCRIWIPPGHKKGGEAVWITAFYFLTKEIAKS